MISRQSKALATTVFGVALTTGAALGVDNCDPTNQAQLPTEVRQAGYVLNTLHSGFDPVNIDLLATADGGKQWYMRQFFGLPSSDPQNLQLNNDGTLTFIGNPIMLNTAAPSKNRAGWVGTAFGGGAYFSSVLKFTKPASTPRDVFGPVFWSIAVEHLVLQGDQWQGQVSGYKHFMEPDFFEYDLPPLPNGDERYGGAIHEWYGIYRSTCPSHQYCEVNNSPYGHTRFSNFEIRLPHGTDLSEFHEYGFLWITATRQHKGMAKYFFDGKETDDYVTWSPEDNTAPPPGEAPWTFALMDKQHFVVSIGTHMGYQATIRCVNVWQSSASENLVQ